jgi:cellulose synthase/poly-beta-1,6-N-acetylglucosamine synthase-like glycosyltransferase
MVQARWGHHNRDSNLMTRVQALFLDGHQVVEQVARSRSNLLLNFNGTGGMWRAECIRDSGGWAWDTLAEDVDLSYRAQMKGWQLVFLPDLLVPGEIPVSMTIFKKQQYRWTFGHIQAFRKLIGRMWTSPGLTIGQRLGGSFHLSANFMQVAALLMFLLSVPMALLHPRQPSSLGLISMASIGPSILFAVSQIFGYHEGFGRKAERLLHLPMLILVAIGLTFSNCTALFSVYAGGKMVWSVTPKAARNGAQTGWSSSGVPLMVWVEIAMSIYCAVGLSLALRQAHELIPLTTLGMLSFGYVGCSCLVENSRPKKAQAVQVEMAHD